MVRVPLEELVLQIHLLKLGKSHDFLQRVLEPPPPKSVEGALSQLQSVGALSKEEQLTPLGAPGVLQPCQCSAFMKRLVRAGKQYCVQREALFSKSLGQVRASLLYGTHSSYSGNAPNSMQGFQKS